MADRYLVATGEWANPATWAYTSGGTPGANPPTADDDVFLNAASGTAILTITTDSVCKQFNCTGFSGVVAGSSRLSVHGDATFSATMGITATGVLSFVGPGTSVWTPNGKKWGGSVVFATYNSGVVQLAGHADIGGSLTLAQGNFNADSYVVYLSGTAVSITGAFTGVNAFYGLTRNPSAVSGATMTLFNNIEVKDKLVMEAGDTSFANRLVINSDIRGTSRTITAKTVSAKYCDFKDIAGAGDADWDLSAADGLSGDCGGNSGITFTSPTTMYQVGSGNHNFSADVWKTTSGGSTATRRPLPQDTAVLDANSTTGTMTQDLQRISSINAAAFVGTLTTNTACVVLGSITLGSGLTLTASTQTYTLAGRGTHTVTNAGHSWAKSIVIDAPGGSYTLQDNLTIASAQSLRLIQGTFNANNFDVALGSFNASGNLTRSLSMGSGTWTVSGNVVMLWDMTTTSNLTHNGGTALIRLTGALTANRTARFGTLTYHSYENATTGNFAVLVRGGPTFGQFKVNAGRKQQFYRSQTVTATTWILEGTAADPIELSSDDGTAAVVAKAGGGTVTAKYATITRLHGTPAPDVWFARNSVDVDNNSGWRFLKQPTVTGIAIPAKVNTIELPFFVNGIA